MFRTFARRATSWRQPEIFRYILGYFEKIIISVFTVLGTFWQLWDNLGQFLLPHLVARLQPLSFVVIDARKTRFHSTPSPPSPTRWPITCCCCCCSNEISGLYSVHLSVRIRKILVKSGFFKKNIPSSLSKFCFLFSSSTCLSVDIGTEFDPSPLVSEANASPAVPQLGTA